MEAVGCETPGLLWVNTVLGNVKRYLYGTCRHCAPCYAPRCVPESQYRFKRRYDLVAMPQWPLQAATALPLPRPILMSGVA